MIRLIEYAKQNRGTDSGMNNEDTLSVTLSIDNMAKELNTPKRTVVMAVKSLTEAGVLIRTNTERVDKKRGAAPMKTEISREVYGNVV